MTTWTFKPIVAIVLAFWFLLPAAAQQLSSPVNKKGTTDVEVFAGGMLGFQGGTWAYEGDGGLAGVRVGKVLTGLRGSGMWRGSLEYGFDLIPAFVVSNPRPVYGGGFDPVVARWNFAGNSRAAAHVEVALGGIFSAGNVPTGDTSNFNFVPRLGLGWQVFTGPRHSIDASLGLWHLSNAWLGRYNPSFNGVQLVIGYHWFRLKHATLTSCRGCTKP